MAEQVGPATGGGAVASAGGMDASAGALGASTGSMGASASAELAPFVSQVPGTPVHFQHYNGRPVSWVAVSLILVGFLAGGLALVFGPTWWVFWLACAISAVGALLALATGIFDDWY
jgi:hypothetical protein